MPGVRGIDIGHGRFGDRRGGPFRRIRHRAVRRRQRHRRQFGLFAGGFQHRLDRCLLNGCRLDRIIPRQVDHFFNRDRLRPLAQAQGWRNRFRLRNWSRHRRAGTGSHRCNWRSDYRRNDRRGSH
jgi:hypothetical protein